MRGYRQLSPVIYRVNLPGDSQKVSVHLAHFKLHRSVTPHQYLPDYEELSEYVLGQIILVLDFGNPDVTQPIVGSYLVDSIASHCPRRRRVDLTTIVTRGVSMVKVPNMRSKDAHIKCHNATRCLQHTA